MGRGAEWGLVRRYLLVWGCWVGVAMSRLSYASNDWMIKWFSYDCSRFIGNKKVVYKKYLSLNARSNFYLYISAQNPAKSNIQLTKETYVNKWCHSDVFFFSSLSALQLNNFVYCNFSYLSFPPLLHSAGATAITFVSKAEPLSHTFHKHSTFYESRHIPSIFSCFNTKSYIRTLRTVFSIRSLASTLKRFMDFMECSLSFLITVFQYWHPAWSSSFVLVFQHLLLLPAGSVPT